MNASDDRAHKLAACGYEAVVIGGGPAGTSAALLLARAGWSVALVERKTFPRRKVCGEYLSATNLPLLDRLGIGERFRALAGPPVKKVGLFAESSWPYNPNDNQTSRVNCHESATWASKAVSVQGKKTVKLGPVVWLAGPGESPKGKRVDDPMVLMAILAKGNPVNIAIDCAGSGWDNGKRIDVELDAATKKPVKPEGGHGLLVVGYDYDQKVFKFKNSWDTDWGDAGYGYLTFDYLKTYVYGGYYATGIVK